MRARRLLFPEVHHTAWEEFEVPERPEPHGVIARSICSRRPGSRQRRGKLRQPGLSRVRNFRTLTAQAQAIRMQ